MDQQLTTGIELLQRRLALLRDLAASLEQVQTAVVRSDLRAWDGHTARQREICEALRHLEAEAFGNPAGAAAASKSRDQKAGMGLPEGAASAEVRERWKMLAKDLSQVELEVSQLNQVYGALLRRAGRTVQIFARVLASSAITYAPPKPFEATVQPAFREVSHV